MIKKVLLLSLDICLLTSYMFSQGTWTQKADFGGGNRVYATGFSIGTKGYIGLGSDTAYAVKNDFWEYDPSTDAWTQKANYIGPLVTTAVGFGIGTKGYVGTGNQGGGAGVNTFYEWDQGANTWTQKNNFIGGRWGTIGFSIGNKGYIGTGINGPPNTVLYDDLWEYNPATDIWTQKANFGGSTIWDATGFSIGTKGYIGTGFNGGYPTDFWEWDQATNVWTQKASFAGGQRRKAVGFSIGTKGYIGMGSDNNSLYNDFWEWEQSMNIWSQKTSFTGTIRGGQVGFSIGTKGYVGTGGISSTIYYKDFWEYCDTCIAGINELQNQISISIFPNPFLTQTTFTLSNSVQNASLKVFSISGEEVKELQATGYKLQVDREDLKSGVYFYQLISETKTIATGKLIIQ